MANQKYNVPRSTAAATPTVSAPGESSSAAGQFVMIRETIESIVVAFVLAFFIRTFEAEAFVIPTGSMSPALQGRHKDVVCTQCGARFRTTASTEDPEEASRRGMFANIRDAEVVAGMCPMCRYPMPFTRNLPPQVLDEVREIADLDKVTTHGSYPGDRILVNKYGFDFADPERWDVVVFKFPGDGNMNYIKRLVGLPNEELKVYQGDVFTRPLDDKEPYHIQAKPADKVAAMLQPVHDTDYESALLYKAGWPLRWAPTSEEGWKVDAEKPGEGDLTVKARYSVDLPAEAPAAWLRYRHLPAERTDDWAAARRIVKAGSLAAWAKSEGVSEEQAREAWEGHIRTRLITDFNTYNARLLRGQLNMGAAWSMDAQPRIPEMRDGYLGMNWVGDLAVECDVNVQEARGEMLLDLVEAGYHFQATIDLKTGACRVAIIDGRTGEPVDFEAKGQTSMSRPGTYNVRLANVDDQVLLWVDGDEVKLRGGAYDPDKLFAATGGREKMIPWASDDMGGDHGDLQPAGVGAKGAKLDVTRLAVFRDTYYIAAKADDRLGFDAMHMDYDSWRAATTADGASVPALNDPRDLFALPETWPRFLTRRAVEFKVAPEQLFVMGDNSPESADCRLWTSNTVDRGIPGGAYLDRRLLIGKAICVFWPHSWGSIPGLPKLPGWPNFRDMRLVR
jgi:signal peptidase I